jgi:hypothetical protein
MKVLAIIILSVMIIAVSLCFLAFCMCAIAGGMYGHATANERALWVIAAVVALGSIIAMAKLVRKLNRSIGL